MKAELTMGECDPSHLVMLDGQIPTKAFVSKSIPTGVNPAKWSIERIKAYGIPPMHLMIGLSVSNKKPNVEKIKCKERCVPVNMLPEKVYGIYLDSIPMPVGITIIDVSCYTELTETKEILRSLHGILLNICISAFAQLGIPLHVSPTEEFVDPEVKDLLDFTNKLIGGNDQ